MPRLIRRVMENIEPDLNSRLQPIMAWLFHTPSPNALNTVLSMTGSIKPVFRLPYYPVNRKERQYIYDLLKNFDNDDWIGNRLEIMEDDQFILTS